MSDLSERATGSGYGWLAFRMAVFVAGASLLVYIAYRYVAGSHPAPGASAYGIIFPASSLLALAGMYLAVRPMACACSGEGRGRERFIAGSLTAISGVWIFTGLQCAGYLAQTTLDTPLRGFLETFHMAAQHVFLSLGVVALAWVPHRVAGWCGADAADPEALPADAVAEPVDPGAFRDGR